ncbi:MAG: regulatory protein SipA, partial [Elainellaceae cyanobacterium]
IASEPPYVKTAETMPMMRTTDVVKLGEEGTVVDYRPGNHWCVRFEQGTFLIDSQYLEKV